MVQLDLSTCEGCSLTERVSGYIKAQVCCFVKSLVFQPCLRLTCGHLSISCGGPIGDDALDLEEFVRLVASDNSEAEAHVALLE